MYPDQCFSNENESACFLPTLQPHLMFNMSYEDFLKRTEYLNCFRGEAEEYVQSRME